MTSLLRLYPRDWRARYEDEFLSLLAERPPDARDRVDIVRGALDARLRPQVPKRAVDPRPEPVGPTIASRSIAFLVLLGVALWFTGFVVAANGPVVVDGAGQYRDGAAAIPFTFGAFILLGVGLIQVARDLPRGSDVGGLAAALAVLTGAIWSVMPWMLFLLGVASIGCVVLAIVARRAGTWGRLDTTLVVGGVGIAWVILVVTLSGTRSVSDYGGFFAFWVALSGVWFGVARALIAGRRVPALDGPAASD